MKRTPILQVADSVTSGPARFPGSKTYFATADVDGASLLCGTPVTYKDRPSRANLAAEHDDILFAKMKSTDKVVHINEMAKDAIFSTGFFNLRSRKKLLYPRYLFWFLRSPGFTIEKDNRCTGATQKALTLSGLREIEIPLPDAVEDQERIASILDEADAIRRKRMKLLSLADDFVRSSFLERFGHPLDPNGRLVRSNLGEHCDFFAGGSLPKAEEYLGQEEGLLLIKVSDLNSPGNEIGITSAKLWAPSRAAVKGGVIAPRGSVVFPKRGGAIATNKKRILERDCVLDPNLMAVAPRPQSTISNNYVRIWFELIDLSSISSGSSVPQLNKKDLSPLAFGVPEQEDVDWFDGIFERVYSMKRHLSDALVEADSLFTSVSQRAFRGEL